MARMSGMISSPPDREGLVFEIWIGDIQLAEVLRELGEEPRIEIYPRPGGEAWSLPLGEFVSLIEKGKTELLDPNRRSVFDD